MAAVRQSLARTFAILFCTIDAGSLVRDKKSDRLVLLSQAMASQGGNHSERSPSTDALSDLARSLAVSVGPIHSRAYDYRGADS